MTTREEAAAKAQYEHGDLHERWAMAQPAMRQFHLQRMEVALSAADAHDAAHGVHRVSLDDATVERAARGLARETFTSDSRWDELSTESRDWIRKTARTVLAAAVGGDGE